MSTEAKRKRRRWRDPATALNLKEPSVESLLDARKSEDIYPYLTIRPQERYGLQIFVFDDGSIGLTQTIDREPRTIALCADEAEILADRLPDAILAADKLRRGI